MKDHTNTSVERKTPGAARQEYDQLDSEVRAAIEEAEAEYQRGGGIPLEEAFTRLRQKQLGTEFD